MVAVSCGEFCGQSHLKNLNESEPLDEGPTIIYVPTRKQTLGIAAFLLKFGIKAAAYNAKVSTRINSLSNSLFVFRFPLCSFSGIWSH